MVHPIASLVDEYNSIDNRILNALQHPKGPLNEESVEALNSLIATHKNTKILLFAQKLLNHREGPSFLNILPPDLLAKTFSYLDPKNAFTIIKDLIFKDCSVRIKLINLRTDAYAAMEITRPILEEYGTELHHFETKNSGSYYELLALLDLNPNLTSIEMNNFHLTSYQLENILGKLDHSKLIACQFPNNYVSCKPFSSLTNLKLLNIENIAVHDVKTLPFSALAALTHLNLSYNQLNPEKIEHISYLTALNSLDVRHCNLKTIAPFSNLTNLRTFYCSGSEVTLHDDKLSVFTNLTSLNLSSQENGTLRIILISPLFQLRSLNLASNNINDSMTKSLRKLVNLTELILSFNSITTVKHLKRLVGLTNLNLYQNKITDDGLKKITRLSALTTLTLVLNPLILNDCLLLKKLPKLVNVN